MALNDLTNQNIQDTYQKVVQTDGVNLADGTGSALPIKFDGPDLIVSGALRAQSYIVSESVVNVSSGSTVFGDSSDDSHTFKGNITASGTISASGMIQTAGAISSSTGITASAALFSGNITGSGTLKIAGDIHANGNIIGDDGTTISNINTIYLDAIEDDATEGDTKIELTGTTLNIDVGGETFIESQGDRLKFHTNITASGAISASGMIQTAGAISSSTGITASNALFSGNITASGNISASGTVTGNVGQFNQIKIDGEVALDTGDSATEGRVFLDTQITKIQIGKPGAVTNTAIEGNITASGNISASGDIQGTGFYTPTARFIDASANNAAIQKSDGGSLDTLQLKATETQVASFKASSHITASGNISASGDISSSLGFFTEGTITAEHIESTDDMTVAGDLDVAGEIECDHLNISDTDDGIHFGDTQVLFIDGDNNVNLGVSGVSVVDLELYGYNQTMTAGNMITLDAPSAINLDSAIGNIHFKDAGTTQLSLDMDGTAGAQVLQLKVAGDDLIFESQGGDSLMTLKSEGQTEIHGNITASGNISASSADSILTIPRRHLDQTVQGSVADSTGSLAQGDIYYAQSDVATVPGKIYALIGNGNQGLADLDNENSAGGLIGVAIGTQSATDGYLLRGMVKLHTNPFPGEGELGNPVYLNDAGLATGSISGHASDDYIRIIGYGISGSGTIYFNPDNTFIKKA